jgi:ubiquinone/menaquinone biosynthesis C-methylase UbiE
VLEKKEWWEEGEYYSDLYLTGKHYECVTRPEFVTRQVDFFERQVKLPPGSEILEIACNVGHVSIELARRGYIVTALDINRSYLQMARKAAKEAGVRVRFVRADMRSLPFTKKFAAVVTFGSSIGMFKDEKQNRQVFEEISRVLLPGGSMLYEAWVCDSKEQKRVTRKTPNRWKEKKIDDMQYFTAWWENGRIIVRIRSSSQKRTQQIDYKPYSPSELRPLLQSLHMKPRAAMYVDEHGWQQVPKKKSWRMVLVAEK